MPYRLKKFIGMIILVTIVIAYAFFAIILAEPIIHNFPWYIHLAFFFISGLVWILPAMFIIWWMERKPKTDP